MLSNHTHITCGVRITEYKRILTVKFWRLVRRSMQLCITWGSPPAVSPVSSAHLRRIEAQPSNYTSTPDTSPPQHCKRKSRESEGKASRIKNYSSSRVDWGRLSPSNQDATERRAIPEAEAARNGLDVDQQAAVRLASCRGLDLQNFSAALSKGIVCHEQSTGAGASVWSPS